MRGADPEQDDVATMLVGGVTPEATQADPFQVKPVLQEYSHFLAVFEAA